MIHGWDYTAVVDDLANLGMELYPWSHLACFVILLFELRYE